MITLLFILWLLAELVAVHLIVILTDSKQYKCWAIVHYLLYDITKFEILSHNYNHNYISG